MTQRHGQVHGGPPAPSRTAPAYAALTLFDEESEVLTVEYEINLLAPAAGDHLEAIGRVLGPGRTLTVCQPEVYGLRADGVRKRVADGRQTLIRVNGTAG